MSNPQLAQLPTDIYRVLTEGGASMDAVKEAVMSVGTGAATRTRKQLERASATPTSRALGTLYASEIGHPCIRKAWYEFHARDKAEPISGTAKFKFLYGDMLEALVLPLAKLAGHSVEGENERVEWNLDEALLLRPWKIVGKIDAVIDGHVVDVKSMASPSFDKYTKTPLDAADMFGYRWQLAVYRGEVPTGLSPKDNEPALLAIDKQLGKLAVIMDTASPVGIEVEQRGRELALAIERTDEPPRWQAATKPGTNGNTQLGTVCSYCAYKQHCFRDVNNGHGLMGFHYSTGPVWFSDVKKIPNVPSIGRIAIAA